MNPIRFRTRHDLISYIANNAPRRAIERAIVEGSVRVLGGFHMVPPNTDPGWIASVMSKHKKVWHVVVSVDEIRHRYRVWIVDEVPWAEWAGEEGRNHPVYDGDDPRKFTLLRKLAGKSTYEQMEEDMR